MRKVFISLLALATLASCTQNEFEEQITDNEKVEVKLASTVADIEVGTRAPIEDVTDLEAKVLLSKATGDYTNTNLLHHGKMTFTDTSTPASFETPQYYPANGDQVYLCGLYPFSTTDWTIGTAAATTATYTFDGKTDVMAAAEQFSTKVDGQDGGTPKELAFNHLLTKVIVKAVVEGDATAVQNSWGNITSIVLSEAGGVAPNNTVSVNLKAGTAPTASAFSGSTAPEFYQVTSGTTYTDNLFSAASIAIPSTATAIAYSMVAPVELGEGAEFKLKIKTANHTTEQEVSIDLTLANNVTATDMQGRECTITLKFKATGVNATASVAAWGDGSNSDVVIQ